MGSERYPAMEEQGNVGMLAASGRDGGLCVLAYNQQIPDQPAGKETVELQIDNCSVTCAEIFRIDEEHGNARKLWDNMGCPEYPDADQMGRLYQASVLGREELAIRKTETGIKVEFEIPEYGVALIQLK